MKGFVMNPSRSTNFGSLWEVSHVHFIGVVKNSSGELTSLLHFKAELRSTKSRCAVEVQIDARSLDRLLKRLGMGIEGHRHSNNGAQPRTITKLIEELLAIDLSFEGSNHWDPVRLPRWQLGERAMARLTEDSLKDNNSERHLSPRFLAFVGNLLRSA
jgi:hypothetical protein